MQNDRPLNILINSTGRRNNLILYFKEALGGRGKIYAGDVSSKTAGIYFADGFIPMLPCDDPAYMDTLEEACKKYDIQAVVSLTDNEMHVISQNEERLSRMGVTIIGSPFKTVECCVDKLFLYRFCETNGFYAPKTYLGYDSFKVGYDKGDISFPVYIKPRTGSASVDNVVARSMEEVVMYCHVRQDLLIQEYMDAQELGVDIYCDMKSDEVISVFVKDKISMRSGETEKAVSSKHDGLVGILEDFTRKMGLRGVVDIDLFKRDGRYYFIDVNPRFGGGYPLAHRCGCDFPAYIIGNLLGQTNEPCIGDYKEGLYMFKCEELVFKDTTEIL